MSTKQEPTYQISGLLPEPMLPWANIINMIERMINSRRAKLLETLKEQAGIREAQARALRKAIKKIEAA